MKSAKIRRQERGSMFLVALAALAILTVIGLSLAMVTETEMLLGANEWVITETHFAAEAGITTAVSKLLVSHDLKPVDIVTQSFFSASDDPGYVGSSGDAPLSIDQDFFRIGFDIKSSGLQPVSFGIMPYSKANEGAPDRFYGGYFNTIVRAQRTSWNGNFRSVPTCDDIARSLIGQKHVDYGFYHSPIGELSAEALVDWERSGVDTESAEGFCDAFGTANDTVEETNSL
ncbi:MAG: hypothetical protein AAGF23_06140 [Acidobacteriota bacterium]